MESKKSGGGDKKRDQWCIWRKAEVCKDKENINYPNYIKMEKAECGRMSKIKHQSHHS